MSRPNKGTLIQISLITIAANRALMVSLNLSVHEQRRSQVPRSRDRSFLFPTLFLHDTMKNSEKRAETPGSPHLATWETA